MAGLVLLGGYYYPSLRGDVLVLALQALPVIGDVWHHTFGPFVGDRRQRGSTSRTRDSLDRKE